jgi:glycerol-3-phosphate acyltransferase PlsY
MTAFLSTLVSAAIPELPWPAWLAISFLAGSIPFGLLIARAKGVDIRAHGSGNIGATNVGRVMGRKFGIACFALDALKGAIPTMLAGLSRGAFGTSPSELAAGDLWWWLAVAVASLLGHMFSPWIGFKGGKGVATGFGALAAMWTPLTVPAAVALATWLAAVKISRTVSIASIAGALAVPIAVAARIALSGDAKASLAAETPTLAVASAVAILVVWKHRSNLVRLVRGEELKVKA